MPIIAYQSFNANASKTHGLTQTSGQRFTKDTNRYVTGQGHQALVLPSNPGNLTAPIYGPAHLVPIETLDSSQQTTTVFGSHIALAWQNFYRQFGGMPDVMVFGELDARHSDFSGMWSDKNVNVTAFPQTRACQSFSSISQTALASQIVTVGSGEGFVVMSVAGFIVVFVHVPNRIATKSDETKAFYKDIAQTLGQHGIMIHLVIGDTNQSSPGYTAEVLNAAFQTTAYKNAGSGGVKAVDNWNVTSGGTNSNATKMYDVAVYRSDVVEMKKLAYLSQSSGGVTVTDHCGLAVQIEGKKQGT